jgi:hypothetical protein
MEPKACVTAQQIIDWFLQHYTDPAYNCPWDDGYVFIFGGPYDAREEIEDNCTNAPAEAIQAAVTYLENGDPYAEMEGGFGGCWLWSGVATEDWYR